MKVSLLHLSSKRQKLYGQLTGRRKNID